jgi:hypothetical protein
MYFGEALHDLGAGFHLQPASLADHHVHLLLLGREGVLHGLAALFALLVLVFHLILGEWVGFLAFSHVYFFLLP